MTEKINTLNNLVALAPEHFPSSWDAIPVRDLMEETMRWLQESSTIPRHYTYDSTATIALSRDGRTEMFQPYFAQSVAESLILGILPKSSEPINIAEARSPHVELRVLRPESVVRHLLPLRGAGIDPRNVNLVGMDINAFHADGSRSVFSGKEAIAWGVSRIKQAVGISRLDKRKPVIFNIDLEPESHDYDQFMADLNSGEKTIREAIAGTWSYQQLASHGFRNIVAMINITTKFGGITTIGTNILVSQVSNSSQYIPIGHSINGQPTMNIRANLDATYPGSLEG